jgi:predicted MFS family arabinose efflux permease
MMGFMAWMAVMIFIPVFAPSLPILAWGESMCGISWGVFQTLSTAYASEGTLSGLLFPLTDRFSIKHSTRSRV